MSVGKGENTAFAPLLQIVKTSSADALLEGHRRLALWIIFMQVLEALALLALYSVACRAIRICRA